MRIRKPIALTLFLIAVISISSCLAMSPKEKMLLGTWTPQKVSPYTPPVSAAKTGTSKKTTAAARPATDTTQQVKKDLGTVTANANVEARKAEKLSRFMETQLHTTFTLNADKTCTIQYPNRKIEAKWKLKNKGNNLLIKVPASGVKRTLELVFLNDTSAMAVQKSEEGSVIIRYSKKK
jgi:hypothetical protein